MKLCRIGNKNEEKPAVIDAQNNYRDLSIIIDDFTPQNLNQETIKKIKNLDVSKLPIISKDKRIGSCIKNPGKFVAIGLNYSDHAKETGLNTPSEPIIFMKAVSSICGPNDNIEVSKDSRKLDWEVELAFVVGKEARNIKEIDAPEHILGYCIVNDISEREWQIEKLGQWTKGKSADTFGPTGPFLVTKDEIEDLNNLSLILKVNDQVMQSGNTKNMIFNTNFILSYLSKFMSLQPGDLITTGTPAGVGMGKKPQKFLKNKDQIKISITGLGEQNSTVVNF